MFKRILKVTGFVALGFVLLIGGVIAFMAIRGDFKKQVIKPTAISFSVENPDLVFDASLLTTGSQPVYSFTVTAKPLNVTETGCVITTSSKLVSFITRQEGKWVAYNSNKFHLNTPIYFRLLDISEDDDSPADRTDGVIEFVVKDSSGLLKSILHLNVDRIVTSISIKDKDNPENNKITNGLFGYEIEGEVSNYKGVVPQKLEAVEREDYPLQIITAPLKSDKPFNNEEAKVQEIYYMDNNQHKRLSYDANENKVYLERLSDTSNEVDKDECDFVTYDTTEKRFVFNPKNSGEYKFKLATYPTYAIQEALLGDETLSFIDRVQHQDVITKEVIFNVSGREVEKMEFEGDENDIRMGLLQDNLWIAKDGEFAETVSAYNLGLTLSKSANGSEINSRFNELQFLTNNSFVKDFKWTFRKAKTSADNKIATNGNVEFENGNVIVEFKTTNKKVAKVSGLAGLDKNIEYEVSLEKRTDGANANKHFYALVLKHTPENGDAEITITFNLKLAEGDEIGKILYLTKYTEEGYKWNQTLTSVSILAPNSEKELESSTIYLELQTENCFILESFVDELDSSITTYDFKTLKEGLYVAILNNVSNKFELINDKFAYDIIHDGVKTQLVVKPIDASLKGEEDIRLYAIGVNKNGTWTSTTGYKTILVEENATEFNFDKTELYMPVVVEKDDKDIYSKFSFGDSYNVEFVESDGGLVKISKHGSYTEVLMFAPKYSALKIGVKPKEWGYMQVFTQNTSGEYVEASGDFNAATQYYTLNNYRMLDGAKDEEGNVINHKISVRVTGQKNVVTEYFLLGYIEDGKFVNKVVPTGMNYYSTLYAGIIKTAYNPQTEQLISAEDYVMSRINTYIEEGNKEVQNPDEIIEWADVVLDNRNNEEIIFNDSKYITASSYVDLDSLGNLVGSFGGSYFENQINYIGNQVIAGHSNIDLGWDGTTDNPIKTLGILVNLSSQVLSKDVYNRVYPYLNPIAVEYKGLERIAQLDSSIIELSSVNQNGTYYINRSIEVKNTITEGNSIVIEWYYTAAGENVLVASSPALKVVSRELQGFSVDVGKVYNPDGTEYIGNVRYEVEIGYGSDYTYTVYVLDEEGNRLKNAEGEDVRGTISQAFSLKQNGGWIRPEPFYAVDCAIDSIKVADNYIEFDSELNIVMAVLTNSFKNATVSKADKKVEIALKVTQDGKFGFNTPQGLTNQSGANVIIPTIYTYNEESIDDKLSARIKSFTITGGSSKYEAVEIGKGAAIVEKENKENAIINVEYTDGSWKITRKNYVAAEFIIVFSSIYGDTEVECSFVNDFSVTASTTNKTNVVYSNTQFVLGKMSDADVDASDLDAQVKNQTKALDTAYIFTQGSAGYFEFGVTSIELKFGKYILTVPEFPEPTTLEISIKFKFRSSTDTDEVTLDPITLTIMPNLIIKGNESSYALDDANNNSKSISTGLTFFEYKNKNDNSETSETIEYVRYADWQLIPIINTENLNLIYECYTYTNSSYNMPYSVNIGSINSGTLTINSPVSEAGTYYVLVKVFTSNNDVKDVYCGDVKFVVDATAEVVAQEVANPLTIIAKDSTNSTYSSSDLSNAFTLSYNEKSSSVKDVLWFRDVNDENLKITYNYTSNNNVTLLQVNNTLTYKDIKYTLVGNKYGMTNFSYDLASNKLLRQVSGAWQNVTPEYEEILENLNNFIYFIDKDRNLTIYCKQNAYIFESSAQVMVLTAEDDADTAETDVQKTLYLFDKSQEEQLSEIKCGALNNLTLKYDTFGTNLKENSNHVAQIDYRADFMFEIEDVTSVIKTANVYHIQVAPNIVKAKITEVMAGAAIKLYGGFLDVDSNNYTVDGEKISISISRKAENYKISGSDGSEVITFAAKGNSYTAQVTVTLTYPGGQKYEYIINIDVHNSVDVEISYPYNVELNDNPTDEELAASEEFSASIDVFGEPEDYAKWLGVDTTKADWDSETKIKFDIALKGDKINLAEDALRNINRYKSYEYSRASEINTKLTYYIYTNNKYEEVEETPDSVEGYYVRKKLTTNIQKVELVAVSNLNGQTLETISEMITFNGTTLEISSSLQYTTYMLFKLYAADLTPATLEDNAYGYYAVRVVDDSRFSGVSVNRNVETITLRRDQFAEGKLKEGIASSIHEIKKVYTAGNVGQSIINTNLSNVYLFAVADDRDSPLPIGQYISRDYKDISLGNNINKLTIAVVVGVGKSSLSLVHVCNYNVVIPASSTVAVLKDGDKDLVKTIVEGEYEKEYTFDYNTENNTNTKILASYFKVENGDGTVDLSGVTFVKDDRYYKTELWHVDSNDVDSNDVDSNAGAINSVQYTCLKYKDANGAIIAYINSSNKLVLNYDVSEDCKFRLQLKYGDFNIYLDVIIKKFEFKVKEDYTNVDTTIGTFVGNSFKTTYELSGVMGNYNKSYNIISDNEGIINSSTNNVLKFNSSTEKAFDVTITLTLNKVYPNVTRIFKVTVNPSINAAFNVNGSNISNKDNRLTFTEAASTEADPISNVGSSLKINRGNEITIGDDAVTINANGITGIEFKLDVPENKATYKVVENNVEKTYYYNYFVGTGNFDKETGVYTLGDYEASLKFVHSPQDLKVTLNIVIKTGTGTNEKRYEAIKLYGILPKTYELESAYRVEGATFEAFTVEDTIDMSIPSSSTDISTDFFGDASNGGTSSINTSRLQIKTKNASFDSTQPESETNPKFINWQGYTNLSYIGLFETSNPNALEWSLDIGKTTDKDSTDEGSTDEGSTDKDSTNEVSTPSENTITFRGSTGTENTIKLSSPIRVGMTDTDREVDYNIKVYLEGENPADIKINDELLQIPDASNSNELDYIVTTGKELENGIKFAIANYAIGEGFPGKVLVEVETISNGESVWAIDSNWNYTWKHNENTNTVEITLKNADLTSITNIQSYKINIITVNGLSETYTLKVSNYSVAYAYGEGDNAFEKAYGGTEIGKITDSITEVYELENTTSTNPRVKLTNGSNDVTLTFDDSSNIQYIGAVNGHSSHLPLKDQVHYEAEDSSLVGYDKTTGMISARNVAANTNVTMIFNVTAKIGEGDEAQTIVVGRVYYRITLHNNLEIKMAGTDGSKFDLYLGSQINDEVRNNEYTYVNLIQSTDGKYYNNLYITLERKSDKLVLSEGNKKALYNGTQANSIYSLSNVTQYLKFEISDVAIEGETEEDAKDIVTMDNKAWLLKIKGNPEGSFKLKVYTTNGSEYGKTFEIKLHRYDVTQKRNGVLNNNGAGYKSGDEVPLFIDLGNENNSAIGEFAIASYRFGYTEYKEGTDHKASRISIFNDYTTLAYKMEVFKSTTTPEHREDTSKWNSTSITLQTEDADRAGYFNNGQLYVELPVVDFSADGSARNIVTICFTFTYQSKSYDYFVHYLVYNPETIRVNERYENKKVVTFEDDGAWKEGTTLTIMDTQNNGLYSALTLLREQPGDWNSEGGKTYYEKGENGAYKVVDITGDRRPQFVKDTYYQINPNLSDVSKFTVTVESKSKTETALDPLTWNDGVLTGGLPEGLFNNEEEITIRIKFNGQEKFKDTWTFKANQTIEKYDSKPLRDFFTNNEITAAGVDLNTEIIGILKGSGADGTLDLTNESNNDISTLQGFVKLNTSTDTKEFNGSNDIVEIVDINSDNTNYISITSGGKTYNLYKIKYSTSNSSTSYSATSDNATNTVFEIITYYYVLVGYENVISFNFNGGDYYINLDIDKRNIDNGAATIVISDYTTVWKYVAKTGFAAVKTTEEPAKSLDITLTGSAGVGYSHEEGGNISCDATTITLTGINGLTSNGYATIRVTAGSADDSAARSIQVYFNIAINAKEYNAGGCLKANTDLTKKMQEVVVGETLVLGKDENLQLDLKKQLLDLIKLNGRAFKVTEEIAKNFTIAVSHVNGEAYYEITYRYEGSSTYERAFQIAISSKISAALLNDSKMLAKNTTLNTAMSSVEKLDVATNETTNAELKTALLGLIKYDGADVSSGDFGKWAITITKLTGVTDYYKITYKYNNGDVSDACLFKIATN